MKIINSDKIRFIGPVLELFIDFPLFREDFYFLIEKGFIKPISSTQLEWTKSKTSLAEYFRWIGVNVGTVTGGFWSPIARAFNKEKGTLRKLAGANGNLCKPEESRDFTKINTMLSKKHEEINRIEREKAVLEEIKNLVNEVKNEEHEKIHTILTKINKIMDKNVDKKNANETRKHVKQ